MGGGGTSWGLACGLQPGVVQAGCMRVAAQRDACMFSGSYGRHARPWQQRRPCAAAASRTAAVPAPPTESRRWPAVAAAGPARPRVPAAGLPAAYGARGVPGRPRSWLTGRFHASAARIAACKPSHLRICTRACSGRSDSPGDGPTASEQLTRSMSPRCGACRCARLQQHVVAGVRSSGCSSVVFMAKSAMSAERKPY